MYGIHLTNAHFPVCSIHYFLALKPEESHDGGGVMQKLKRANITLPRVLSQSRTVALKFQAGPFNGSGVRDLFFFGIAETSALKED
mmetsp:Transcript_20378/g.32527  ORF Transcript_20378/g.32527 Transcript_20378/m.32527 type:complete len:86 (+) Transcript_20378:79-336(+)|eukprot:CAMPEP_0174374324 /NCGR_PEP_ID=MMETSP0811_2-20130205/110457_1 /TAXON_ID=73025 ORGANISM="Eutreptiella gymnastica-like, Strain CCMP1594" /NCGR_SAMPLE_ID=MMETSP0811_2 /ASSEMBLY_ACC=CAM_ASM_000667 /LENGTH=85 /DNA_ID=CAMNT_0015523543 /DNA_START=79 /DNA_END=336 /DNA_ORIENTATION=-